MMKLQYTFVFFVKTGMHVDVHEVKFISCDNERDIDKPQIVTTIRIDFSKCSKF